MILLIQRNGKWGAKSGIPKMHNRVPLQQLVYPTWDQSIVSSSVKPCNPSDAAQPAAPGWVWPQHQRSSHRMGQRTGRCRVPPAARRPFPLAGSPCSATSGAARQEPSASHSRPCLEKVCTVQLLQQNSLQRNSWTLLPFHGSGDLSK